MKSFKSVLKMLSELRDSTEKQLKGNEARTKPSTNGDRETRNRDRRNSRVKNAILELKDSLLGVKSSYNPTEEKTVNRKKGHW